MHAEYRMVHGQQNPLQSSIGLVKLLQLTRLGSKQPKVQECCNLQLQVACREVALSSGGTCMSWWVMCMKPCSPMCTKLLHAVAINPPDLLPANPALQDYPFADLELCWPLSRQHAAQYRIAGYTQQKAAHSGGQAGSLFTMFLVGLHLRWQASGKSKQLLFMAKNDPGHAWHPNSLMVAYWQSASSQLLK